MKKGHMKLKHLAVLFMVYLAVGICVYSACYRNAWGICLRPGDGIKVIPPEPYPCAGEAVIIAVSTYAVGDIVEDVPPGGIGYTKKMYGGWCGPFDGTYMCHGEAVFFNNAWTEGEQVDTKSPQCSVI
jgi:hypothetical protein